MGFVPSMTAVLSDLPWQRQLWPRVMAHWRLKLFAILGFTAVFFAAYFRTLKYPAFPVTVMPTTALDRLIGFHPSALLLYVSLWVYAPLAPMLLVQKRKLLAYGSAVGAISLAGLAIFYFWPTSIPRPDVDWARYPGFEFLKTIDRSGNACPSLHVTFAVYSAIWFDRLLRRMRAPGPVRILNGCWCLGILYSTLATRQHVALDLYAGAALGAIGALFPPRLD